ncbi:MAG TPA: nuclear transport factor 2 family protein [Polyangiaceae bacterium]|nr:nuclear transport factor 2 family protein [Polyangiaceae bacterium]
MTESSEEERRNTETALAYIAALNRYESGETLAACFAEDVVQEEFPSRLVPEGRSHDRASLIERSGRARELLRSQHYEVRSTLAAGRSVALELEWHGVMAKDLGPFREGQELHAAIALFLEFENGRIKRQRNYDCYYPF